MKNRANTFWDSFLNIKDSLMDIDSLDEKKSEELLIQLDEILKKYSSGVDFELGDLTSEGREVIFTASGDEDFFEDVINLAENAPIMDFWKITAFFPANGKNQSIEYEGIKLLSKDLFFIPMESDEVKDKIGMRIAAKGLEKNDNTLAAAYLLCEKMIGEYNATTLIDYFDIVNYENDLKDKGFLPLDYLPDFIQWKIDKIESNN